MTREPPRPSATSEPGALAWSVGLISLALPWVGVPLAIAGLALGLRGHTLGWLALAGGVALLILDAIIDIVWAHPAVSRSDEPGLNRPGAALLGRIVSVAEPIEAGRGKVKAGDTVWIAEGPDAPAGTWVEVTGVDGVVLRVAAAHGSNGIGPPAA